MWDFQMGVPRQTELRTRDRATMASGDFAIMRIRRGCFQKIVDGEGWQTVVPPLNLESRNIFFLNLYLSRVLDPHDTFVVGAQARHAFRTVKVW